jgi:aminopeptidase N
MLLFRDGTGAPATVRREDYAPPAFWIDSVELCFDLDPARTRVLNRMTVRRNPEQAAQALRLNGEELNLARVLVNGQGTAFNIEGDELVLPNLPDCGAEAFQVEIFTTCYPAKNSKLMGLYTSNGSFFTQCEAEGFRRMTYFLDRPDVMSLYSVTLRADKTRYPVLLCNGNLQEQGPLEDGRHFARWVDPHRKPCYLFALVAGQLVCREQRIRARSGREHLLQVYVRPGDLDKTGHAMDSLMAAVAWDEARFGLALDLERFMIVATSDFNMGAMENKGLNIFNTKYVLASQATATDTDYAGIESVVAHEYFHNWTGNRVTCRDWFQLSLKEGLTVFRDQEFSQDLAGEASARAVRRIEDVRLLRNLQFAEDAGPMAHPVRPDSYVEINNFYTLTVYEKGAEVVRMMQTLVGKAGFAKGLALYFERHDGQAVTCDDFAQAIADANPQSELARLLPQFKRWYSQGGTPVVSASGRFDAASRSYTLTLTQSCPATPGQSAKLPFVVPLALGLIDEQGRPLPLQQQDDELPGVHETAGAGDGTRVLVLTKAAQSFTFVNLEAQPVPSLLRSFSAPVTLACNYSDAELLTLLAHDSDPFNRWEAGQRLGVSRALNAIRADDPADRSPLDPAFVQAMRALLRHPALDPAFKELALTLPSEAYIAEQMEQVDPQRIHGARETMRAQLARELAADWAWAWEQNQHSNPQRSDAANSGRRALAGMALSNLCLAAQASGDPLWPGLALQRFDNAGNMTDRVNALSALVTSGHALAADALRRFYAMFRDEALVLDKWFAMQAGAPDRGGQVLPLVRQLMAHPDFNLRNPNRARSLIFTYCNANPGAFHRSDAAGYVFWSERVLEIDAFNPQVAARLARAMDRWKKLAEPYRSAAQEAIARVAGKAELSADVREVVGRALEQ